MQVLGFKLIKILNKFKVIVPDESMDNLTVYKGSQKPIKGDKECILVFDHTTRQCRLEKISSNISVKKSRLIFLF